MIVIINIFIIIIIIIIIIKNIYEKYINYEKSDRYP